MYIDIHTHDLSSKDMAIVNISSKEDIKKNSFCSIGIHPWDINKIDIKYELKKIKKMILEKEIIAIGECGLDRNTESLIKKQKEIFCELSNIAESAKIPLIIHCVRAFPELISLKKKLNPKQAWIIHGFNSNEIILKELLRHNFYISIGRKLLNSQKLKNILNSIPLDKLFLETDDSNCDIRKIYQTASASLNIDIKEVKSALKNNFSAIFANSKSQPYLM